MQQGKWAHRFTLLQERLRAQGMFHTLMFYDRRIRNMLFSRCVFGRWDLNIQSDAHVGGVRHMKIGQRFGAGRGLWMETIEQYGEGDRVQYFHPQLIIGDDVSLSEYVHIGCNNRIVIGNHVLMGSKIYITDHNHGTYGGSHPDSPGIPPAMRPLTVGKTVTIEDNVWIGEFCTILPGVTIGHGSIIGSHTTVTHDIPPNSIAVGSPARVVKRWNEASGSWEKV